MSGGTDGAADRDHVAVLQRRTVAAAGQQRDVLFADRGLAVHFGIQVRGDGDARVQRQHRLDAAVGERDTLDAADFGAAVGDVAVWIQTAGRRQLQGYAVTARHRTSSPAACM